MKNLILDGGWQLIFYTRLFDFCDLVKHRKVLKVIEFNNLIGKKAEITEKRPKANVLKLGKSRGTGRLASPSLVT